MDTFKIDKNTYNIKDYDYLYNGHSLQAIDKKDKRFKFTREHKNSAISKKYELDIFKSMYKAYRCDTVGIPQTIQLQKDGKYLYITTKGNE